MVVNLVKLTSVTAKVASEPEAVKGLSRHKPTSLSHTRPFIPRSLDSSRFSRFWLLNRRSPEPLCPLFFLYPDLQVSSKFVFLYHKNYHDACRLVANLPLRPLVAKVLSAVPRRLRSNGARFDCRTIVYLAKRQKRFFRHGRKIQLYYNCTSC